MQSSREIHWEEDKRVWSHYRQVELLMVGIWKESAYMRLNNILSYFWGSHFQLPTLEYGWDRVQPCSLCLCGEKTSRGSALRAQSSPSQPSACCSASDLRELLCAESLGSSECCVLFWTSSMCSKTKEMLLDKGVRKAKWFSKFITEP